MEFTIEYFKKEKENNPNVVLYCILPFSGFILFIISGWLHGKYGEQIFIGGLTAPVLEEMGKIMWALFAYPIFKSKFKMNWVKGIVYSIVVAGFAFAIFEMICWTIKYPDEVWWVYPYNLGFKLLVHPAFTMLFAIVFIYLNPPNIFTVPFSHL